MLDTIKQLLQNIINNIDAGNSELSENDALEAIKLLKDFTDSNKRMSKYSAYTYLHISRATFDNLVKEGKIPKGVHTAGFKELSWNKKDLDNYKRHKNAKD